MAIRAELSKILPKTPRSISSYRVDPDIVKDSGSLKYPCKIKAVIILNV